MTGDVTDRPALNSLMEKWTPFVKEHFPASHRTEFQTDDLGKATFVDFAKDLSEFERNDKEFQTEVEKYQSLNLPIELTQPFPGVAAVVHGPRHQCLGKPARSGLPADRG